MRLALALALAAAALSLDKDRALVTAAGRGDVPQVKSLLELGADPNYTGGGLNWTPLMAAAEGGHVAVVRLLLEAGADPGVTRGGGVRARDLAVDKRVIELLDKGAAAPPPPVPATPPLVSLSSAPAPLYSRAEREEDWALVLGDDGSVRAHLRALGVPEAHITDDLKRLRRKAGQDAVVYVYHTGPDPFEPPRGLKARRVLVLLEGPAPESAPEGMTILAAGAADPTALFTRLLLEALNQPGEATPRSLYMYVRPKVQRQNRGQTPRLLGEGSWRIR